MSCKSALFFLDMSPWDRHTFCSKDIGSHQHTVDSYAGDSNLGAHAHPSEMEGDAMFGENWKMIKDRVHNVRLASCCRAVQHRMGTATNCDFAAIKAQ